MSHDCEVEWASGTRNRLVCHIVQLELNVVKQLHPLVALFHYYLCCNTPHLALRISQTSCEDIARDVTRHIKEPRRLIPTLRLSEAAFTTAKPGVED